MLNPQIRGAAQRPQWIHEGNAQGLLKLDGKIYATSPQQVVAFNEEAERATLGSILSAGSIGKGKEAMEKVAFLRWNDYFFKRYAFIYRAMERLLLRNEAIDTLTVATELQTAKSSPQATMTLLEEIGGRASLEQLMLMSSTNFYTYGQLVAQTALRRASHVAADRIRAIGSDEKLSITEMVEQQQAALNDVALRCYQLTANDTYSLYDALDAYTQQVESDLEKDNYEPGVTTGMTYPDKYLLGWRKRKLYIIAGRPSMGKSALMLSNALKALEAGKRVLFITLEMELDELLSRIICNLAGINTYHLEKRQLNEYELKLFRETKERVKAMIAAKQFMIVVMRRPTLKQIRSKLTELQFNPGYDAVFIDYGGWNTITPAPELKGDRAAQAGAIFTDFKEMAKEYNIPIIAGCQLNRDCERRKNKRPIMSDLNESGIIEQVADVIIFLYRESMYMKHPPYPTRAELIIAKNRSGRGGRTTTVYATYQAEFTRFYDWHIPPEDDAV